MTRFVDTIWLEFVKQDHSSDFEKLEVGTLFAGPLGHRLKEVGAGKQTAVDAVATVYHQNELSYMAEAYHQSVRWGHSHCRRLPGQA
jgi:hypothetical protein